VLLLIAATACAHAPVAPSGDSASDSAFYDALFRVGQSWEFRTEFMEETESGGTERTSTPPVRCKVASVRRAGTVRRSRVACVPPDEFSQTASSVLQGPYIARPDGLWRIWEDKPSSDDDVDLTELPPGEQLIPVPLARVRREEKFGCMSGGPEDGLSLIDPVEDGHALYTVTPWDDAWCAASLSACHQVWKIDCFRRGVGWIGGAMRHFDSVIPRWREIRWGDAPQFPFGM
jgi:hypothetical protein